MRDNFAEVPEKLLSKHKFVTLCADILFVQRIPFLITVARDIKFTTVE